MLRRKKKMQGHDKDTLRNLINVCIHEFTHTCHFTYNGNSKTMVWFAEALATALSNQYDYLYFDCTLDDIINGKAKYINYYTMGRYLIDNCDKEYILKLARDKNLLESDTCSIYHETIDYVSKRCVK